MPWTYTLGFNPMATLSQGWSFAEWQSLAARSPTQAGQELSRRLSTTFTPEQHRAVFASTRTEAELVAAFERVANTIAPLAGVPYVLKDLFYVAHEPLQAGSGFPPGVIPTKERDSKLPHALRGYGAILGAKAHLYEFAYGLTGENAHFGDCAHPRFPDRTSGGSSSGSAAAVAADVVPFAVGTDTGGSIRVPAAFCGLFAFRAPAGHAYSVDAFPLAPSFDTAGWFTRHPQDLLTLNRFLLGKPKSADRAPRGCFLDFELLGIQTDPEFAAEVRHACEQHAFRADPNTAEQLRSAFHGAADAYQILQSIEACAVHRAWLDTHKPHYSSTVWDRIDRGRKWTPEQEQSARARQTVLRHTWSSFFLTYDYLVLPVAPFPALTRAELTLENRIRLLTLNTPVSLGGLPVLVLPVTLKSGLTTALQVVVNDPLSPVLARLLKR